MRATGGFRMLAPAVSVAALGSPGYAHAAQAIPLYSHVVVVVEENHTASSVLGNKDAPFINALASGGDNHIATIVYGAGVAPGRYDTPVNHYTVLSTIQEVFGLPKTGQAANTPAIAGIWAS